jgi:hypothetical protein
MPEYQLTAEIVQRSEAGVWDAAKLEWELLHVFEAEEPETCLCGHYPIIEICILHNRLKGKEVLVGNCCVKKFVGLPSDKIFQAVKRSRHSRDVYRKRFSYLSPAKGERDLRHALQDAYLILPRVN